MPGAAPSNYGDMLGSASFVLAVDAGTFEPSLKRAEQAARQTSAVIGQSFGRGSSAAMGLLYLGQTVDDLQYGFRAIVNNIPQMAMAFGAGAGMAGAIGVAAVAVNQLTQHWDEFTDAVGRTELGKTIAGGVTLATDALKAQGTTWDDLTEKAEKYLTLIGPLGGFKQLSDRIFSTGEGEGGRALAAGRAADALSGEKLWEKAGSEVVDKQKAADFARAIEESGGLKAVLDAALKEAMKAPGADEATQKGRIAKWYGEGMRGGQFNPDAFGKPFGQLYDAQEKRRMEKRAAEGEEEAKKAREAQQKLTDALNKQGQEIEAATMAEKARGEADALRKQADWKRDRAQDMGQSQVFSGTRAFAANVMTDALNRVPQQQLDEAKRLNEKADRIIEELRKDRNIVGRFG